MFAKWLRDGLRSGRSTESYPRSRDEYIDKYAHWTKDTCGALDAADITDSSAENPDLSTLLTEKKIRRLLRKSLYIRHIDAGSCNACESEILSLSNPYYNFHRLGIFFTDSPRHADVLLVTGIVTKAMKNILIETYEAMPRPRLVIASGVCAINGGLFQSSPRFAGRVKDFLPVDVEIPGCPPNPFALINGLIIAVNKQREGSRR